MKTKLEKVQESRRQHAINRLNSMAYRHEDEDHTHFDKDGEIYISEPVRESHTKINQEVLPLSALPKGPTGYTYQGDIVSIYSTLFITF